MLVYSKGHGFIVHDHFPYSVSQCRSERSVLHLISLGGGKTLMELKYSRLPLIIDSFSPFPLVIFLEHETDGREGWGGCWCWMEMCGRTTRPQVEFLLMGNVNAITIRPSRRLMQLKARAACPGGGLAHKTASGAPGSAASSPTDFNYQPGRTCTASVHPDSCLQGPSEQAHLVLERSE